MSYYSSINLDSIQKLKFNVISSINSTDTPLLALGSWSGEYIDVSEYAEMGIFISTDVVGELVIEFSTDRVFIDKNQIINIDPVAVVQPPYPNQFITDPKLHIVQLTSKYVKIRYVNLLTNQTVFRLQTKLFKIAGNRIINRLDGLISDNVDSTVVRSAIMGKDPYGNYLNNDVNSRGDLYVYQRDTRMYDNLNVNNLDQIFSGNFSYNYINTRIYDTTVSGTGVATGYQRNARMSTGATAGSFSTIQTNKKITYRSGMGVTVNMNIAFSDIENTEVYAGIGNTSDGVFLGWRNNTVSILHRNNSSGLVVSNWIDRVNWSGDTVPLTDFTKMNNIQITYTNIDAVVYIQDSLTNQMIELHRITGKNLLDYGIFGNATNSFFSVAYNLAVASDAYIDINSIGIYTQGYSKRNGITNTVDFSKDAVGTTLTNIITIRNNVSFNSITNFNTVYPLTVSVVTFGTAKPVLFKIIKNATLGGAPVYTNIGVDSVVSYDTAGTTVTGGEVIQSFYIGKEDKLILDLSNIDPFLVPTDILTVACSATLGNVDVNASITFREDI